MQKTNQKQFKTEKIIKNKGDKLYIKWKDYDNSFDSWIDKKILYEMSQCFPKPYEAFGRDIDVNGDLSNYATKTDLKNATGINISELEAKSDLASLKAEVVKIDIDKLKTVPIDLSKLSNVVKNKPVKKTVLQK